MSQPDRRSQIAKEYGMTARGWQGRKGGLVYASSSDKAGTICQGWSSVWHFWTDQVKDYLTAKVTGFDTFRELVSTSPSYRPTLRSLDGWRTVLLADLYDEYMTAHKDSRRAWRGSAADQARVDAMGQRLALQS